jgi:hypothetical protein
MWQLFLVALFAGKPEPYIGSLPPGGSIVDGIAFGPRLRLTCSWSSNFENSRFNQCRGPTGNLLPADEAASLRCVGRTCDQLDEEARRVAHGQKSEAPSGVFTVRLLGRVGLHAHPKQYIGDGTRTVLVERIVSVEKK